MRRAVMIGWGSTLPGALERARQQASAQLRKQLAGVDHGAIELQEIEGERARNFVASVMSKERNIQMLQHYASILTHLRGLGGTVVVVSTVVHHRPRGGPLHARPPR